MGWFDEQVKQRIKSDSSAFSDAISEVVDVINHNISYDFDPHASSFQVAVNVVLKYYHVRCREEPIELEDTEELLEYLLRPSGIMRRAVRLEDAWYQNAIGAFLTNLEDGSPVALIPRKFGGYQYYDAVTRKWIRINRKTSGKIKEDAICFYKPFPLKKLKMQDLLIFILQTLTAKDYILIGLATLATTLIGMLLPYLNNLLFSKVVESGSIPLLVSVGVMMIAVSVSMRLIDVTSSFLSKRVQIKTDIAVESAAMMRLLALPTKFFGDYNIGEISMRLESLQSLCAQIEHIFFTTGLSAIFSFLYIGQIFAYAPSLIVPSLCVTFSTIIFSLLTLVTQTKVSKKSMEIRAKETGLAYALLNGIQKLKLSGAEKRAFSNWAHIYSEKAKITYNPPVLIKFNMVIRGAITTIGTFVLYYFAVVSQVSVANFFAFQSAYGMVSGALMSLFSMATRFASIKPSLDMAYPILNTLPETDEGKPVVTNLYGAVELSHVSFRYKDSMPLLLDDICLKISPGQYVAIVGETGCGKSTLVRLLLGFEIPQKGAIYYDNQDLSTVDLRSIRRRMGVVLQNSKLSAGTIFENIIISAPWLTMDQAWEAAELAGVADDIRAMPMGMLTVLSEGSGGISGGQRQRIMIARAVAARPKLLILDEATSALDNITQKAVVNSLAGLKCTRIVIAHRLSTIKECDRIIYLEGGRIAEDGTYAELIAKNGLFAQLVSHQQIEESARICARKDENYG